MSNGAKVAASIAALLISAVLVVKFFKSSEAGRDVPPGGTWYRCNSCQEVMQIATTDVAAFYEQHPERRGSPMTCPKCEQGLVVAGKHCPSKGCFYRMAITLPDGRPACPVCREALP